MINVNGKHKSSANGLVCCEVLLAEAVARKGGIGSRPMRGAFVPAGGQHFETGCDDMPAGNEDLAVGDSHRMNQMRRFVMAQCGRTAGTFDDRLSARGSERE